MKLGRVCGDMTRFVLNLFDYNDLRLDLFGGTINGVLMQRTNTTDATTDAETLAKVFKRASRFVGRERAFSYAATTAKPSRVMLGDDGRFWVVTPADANRLERMGYEYAN